MDVKQLQQENKALKQDILYLKSEIANLRKMLFGAKRERFESSDTLATPTLFDAAFTNAASQHQPAQEQPDTPTINTQKNKKTTPKKRIGRNQFPAHIPRDESLIEPSDMDTSQMKCIGHDITEVLAYIPGRIKIKKIVRPRYVHTSKEQTPIVQAPIPDRLIPKAMVDESFVAHLMVEKILYHTPIHRLNKKLKQEGIDFIKDKTLHNWLHRGAEALKPLWHRMKHQILASAYVQADESHIKVLKKNKLNSSHRGQMWVLYQPKLKMCYFQYDPTRSQQAAQALIGNSYKGILQTDGYQAYEHIKKQNNCTLIYCMAHGRRKFVTALEAGYQEATYFLDKVQQLYAIEKQARNQTLAEDQRFELRQNKSIPILHELHEWLKEKADDPTILPKSPMGNAIQYNLKRWNGLMAYADSGEVEIDNNLIENQIRPLALGRKNYLFAGSDDTAQNLAVLYSIIGTAKMHDLKVEPYIEWLLHNTVKHKINENADLWLPHKLSPELLIKFKVNS